MANQAFRYLRLIPVLLVLIFLTLAAANIPTPPAAPRPVDPGQNKLGVHLLLNDGRNHWSQSRWPEHLQAAREMTGDWGYVTQLVYLNELDPERWQVFMDLCKEYHLTPILRLATSFDRQHQWWTQPPHDVDGSYATAARRVGYFVKSLSWPTDQHFVIVGNEPNHGNEWGGVPDPAAYARFLIDVSTALHQADPQARVINAPLDSFSPNTNGQPMPDGMVYLDTETFMDQMADAEPDVWRYLDAWGSHSYPTGPFADPPWMQTYQIDLLNGASNPAHAAPPPGVVNRGVNGYEWELWKLSTYGIERLPVLITETGWRHSEAQDPTSPDGGTSLPDAETVARYFDLALRGNEGRYPDVPSQGWTPWLDDPRVMAMTAFALDGNPAEWSHSDLLRLDPAGAILESYIPCLFEAAESR